jgi:hypothetical protein
MIKCRKCHILTVDGLEGATIVDECWVCKMTPTCPHPIQCS